MITMITMVSRKGLSQTDIGAVQEVLLQHQDLKGVISSKYFHLMKQPTGLNEVILRVCAILFVDLEVRICRDIRYAEAAT